MNEDQNPSEPLTIDCSSIFCTTRAYETLFSSTGFHHEDLDNMDKLEMFTKRFYVLGFYLTLESEAHEEHICLSFQGNVSTEAYFKKQLLEPVTFVLYAEFRGHKN